MCLDSCARQLFACFRCLARGQPTAFRPVASSQQGAPRRRRLALLGKYSKISKISKGIIPPKCVYFVLGRRAVGDRYRNCTFHDPAKMVCSSFTLPVCQSVWLWPLMSPLFLTNEGVTQLTRVNAKIYINTRIYDELTECQVVRCRTTRSLVVQL